MPLVLRAGSLPDVASVRLPRSVPLRTVCVVAGLAALMALVRVGLPLVVLAPGPGHVQGRDADLACCPQGRAR